MTTNYAVRTDDGVSFEDGDDRGRILVFGRDTGGLYGLMEYRVASRAVEAATEVEVFSPHRHNTIEETFFVRRGALRFLLGAEVIELSAGDFVRVPPGIRHGYANVSGKEVDLLVSFHPGGFEELFLKYRSDQCPAPAPDGFVGDATFNFASEFEAPAVDVRRS
jgi:mannose-6-phosphate isomerase-like protein (cupin superfamily)